MVISSQPFICDIACDASPGLTFERSSKMIGWRGWSLLGLGILALAMCSLEGGPVVLQSMLPHWVSLPRGKVGFILGREAHRSARRSFRTVDLANGQIGLVAPNHGRPDLVEGGGHANFSPGSARFHEGYTFARRRIDPLIIGPSGSPGM